MNSKTGLQVPTNWSNVKNYLVVAVTTNKFLLITLIIETSIPNKNLKQYDIWEEKSCEKQMIIQPEILNTSVAL